MAKNRKSFFLVFSVAAFHGQSFDEWIHWSVRRLFPLPMGHTLFITDSDIKKNNSIIFIERMRRPHVSLNYILVD